MGPSGGRYSGRPWSLSPMSSPSPAARMPPAASREAELARAESELSTLEARLHEQLAQTTAEASTLATRLEQTRQALTRAHQAPGADPMLGEQASRLQLAAAPALDVEAPRARALQARQAALQARRQAGSEMQSLLRAHQEQAAQVARAVTEAEAVLKRQAEAAKARQEAASRAQHEAAKARQAELARAAAAARAQGHAPLPAAAARPAAAPENDARRNGRVRMHTSIDMRSDSNFFTGFSLDISEGGVFIATVDAVPRGTQVELDFTLPGGRPMKVAGVVRWVREANSRTPELMPGVGVQFTGLPAEVASAISSFVTTRDPMFFPD
ncbi:cell division protein FtsY [Myxococcus xanthus]|uniref:Cell division protein FtsY n=2 Tax=Myxococcus xanthus TaxID=34 RepID=A0AAE6FUP7_MYXXA|nr:cell division protein FtsY [Myxococcus xanthus]QDE72841.1 cell division protein FtsY [Myxococcus xanthus]QDF01657.1 cell division protein FtsY [Myxococcus xanthus]